jgi:GNAT superfamily N-acetyltransferase
MIPRHAARARAALALLLGLSAILPGADPTAPPLAPAFATADPYATWMQGRPQEAIPALVAQAQSDDRWSSWYDAGLAAAAAGDDRAAAFLLAAHHRAPQRPEPLAALHAYLGADAAALPATWCDRLGPALLPGTGWCLVILLALGGAGLGWAALAPRRRAAGLAVALVAAAAVAPGLAASAHDRRDHLVATLRDTGLVDSTGSPQARVPAGSVLVREDARPWSGRLLVHGADGLRGWLPQEDVGGD